MSAFPGHARAGVGVLLPLLGFALLAAPPGAGATVVTDIAIPSETSECAYDTLCALPWVTCNDARTAYDLAYTGDQSTVAAQTLDVAQALLIECAPPLICEPGGEGVIWRWQHEHNWPNGVRAVLYGLLLVWCFFGVAIIADVFMGAIEVITSKTIDTVIRGEHVTVRFWNPTVANLTLMALGSSAPEILLSVIEVCGNQFMSGDLGPSTIVGSAAFNLLVISGICVISIPEGENRRIKQLSVFVITAFFAVFAYVWLVIVLMVISKDRVTIGEATITFLMFPLMVQLAYLADIGTFDFNSNPPADASAKVAPDDAGATNDNVPLAPGAADDHAHAKIEGRIRQIAGKSGHGPLSVTREDVRSILKHVRQHMPHLTNRETMDTIFKHMQRHEHHSRAFYRSAAIHDMTGQQHVDIHLDTEKLHRQVDADLSGVPQHRMVNGEDDVQRAQLIDIDSGGSFLRLGKQSYVVCESEKELKVSVLREGDTTGSATCRLKTVDQTATAPQDYAALDMTLEFKPGDIEMEATITVVDDDVYQKDQRFLLELSQPEGAKMFKNANGFGREATVTIISDEESMHMTDHIYMMMNVNRQHIQIGESSWAKQFHDAIHVGGGDDGAGAQALVLHFIALPWKVLFAFVPPENMGGGFPAFCMALCMIGIVTAVIGDLASLFGCVIGFHPANTAITFVALGTSLPDTFASMAAAKNDADADASIGNVTGSNAVNVFLGLGLPWLICSIVWKAQGSTPDWLRAYETSEAAHVVASNPGGAFIVPAGALGFSVALFVGCALLCIACLVARRHFCEGELGGPVKAKWATFVFFIFLWLVYIVGSIGKTDGWW